MVTVKKVVGHLNGIRWNKEIQKIRKFQIYETTIKSVLLYGNKTWRITEDIK